MSGTFEIIAEPDSSYKFITTGRPNEIWVAIYDGALPLSGVFIDPIAIDLIAERGNEKIYRITAPHTLREDVRVAVDALTRCQTTTVPSAISNLQRAIDAWYQN